MNINSLLRELSGPRELPRGPQPVCRVRNPANLGWWHPSTTYPHIPSILSWQGQSLIVDERQQKIFLVSIGTVKCCISHQMTASERGTALGQHNRSPVLGFGDFLAASCCTVPHTCYLRLSTMTSESPDSKGRDNTISTLDGLIQVLGLAKDTCGIPPAQAAFGAVSALLTIIRVCPPTP